MKQKKISIKLKALDLILAIIVAAFFVGASIFKVKNPDFFYNTDSTTIFLIFAWITAICIFIVLKEFWDVCTQIGNDNSFSIENSKSFHQMNICGIIAAVAFGIRLIWVLATGHTSLTACVILIGEIALSIMFSIIAEALSQLIMNAYEVKHENELTI